jgi:hypothetical protein
MNGYPAPTGPPRTLVERLAQLNDSLQALGEKLKSTIASLIGSAIAEAIRDVVRSLLGSEQDSPPRHFPDRLDGWDNTGQVWQDESPRWSGEEDYYPADRTAAPASKQNPARRWRNACSAGLQTALWWLAHQSCRRPILTTVAVGLAAGVTGFVAGPALAAGVGVLASIASLLLTADASRSAAQILSG